MPPQARLIGSTLAFGAQIAAEKASIPYVTAHLQPSVFQSVYDTPVFSAFSMSQGWPRWVKRGHYRGLNVLADRLFGREINRWRATLGLKPMRHFIKTGWHSAALTLGLFPEWFASVQPDWPSQTRLTPFPLYDGAEENPVSSELDRFLQEGPPPLLFTAGSAMTQAKTFFETSVDVCRQANRRGLLVTRYEQQWPQGRPASVQAVPYVPFSAVLPRISVFVHHGGIGTTAQALRAGVPQIIVPLAHDQFDNAKRVERLGVGKTLPRARYTTANVMALLDRFAADKDLQKRCKAVTDRFKDVDPLDQIAALLERHFLS